MSPNSKFEVSLVRVRQEYAFDTEPQKEQCPLPREAWLGSPHGSAPTVNKRTPGVRREELRPNSPLSHQTHQLGSSFPCAMWAQCSKLHQKNSAGPQLSSPASAPSLSSHSHVKSPSCLFLLNRYQQFLSRRKEHSSAHVCD